MKIIESIISNGYGYINPSFLVIHETDNPGATAKNHVDLWRREPLYAVHYVGDWTENVYHCVPDDRKCNQVGNGNPYVLGIELCHATNAADFQKVWKTGVQFAVWMLKKKGWGIDRLISHDECRFKWGGTDHTDPIGYFKKYGRTWAEFKAEVARDLSAPTAPPQTEKPAGNTQPTGTLYRVQCGAFKLKANAAKLEKKLKADGYDTLIKEEGGLYKVQVGAFSKKENAEALQKKLKAAGYDTVITGTVKKEDVPQQIWNFLKSKGLNSYAVAGIMGNLEAESALDPKNLENSFERRTGYTDDSYTAAVDSGKYKDFVKDGAGYGLAQWTFWSRKQALLDYAKEKKASIGDLSMQLEFLWKELQTYPKVMETLRNAKTVRQASDAVLTGYERPADMSEAVKRTRAGYGEAYYRKYA